MAFEYFGLAGTNDLAGAYAVGSPGGGNGMSLAEGADLANGSYDYNGSAGGIIWARDAIEQQRMAPAYPDNGQPWDWNAATLGVSRLIDSASRAYATANGMTPATYAGQNGLTYANGQLRANIGGGMLPLLVLGFAAFLLMKK